MSCENGKKHNLVHENGYCVCNVCGIAEKIDYFRGADTSTWIEQSSNVAKPVYLDSNWKRLMKRNRAYCNDSNERMVLARIANVLNQLPFSEELKEKVLSLILARKPKNYGQVYYLYYELVYTLDLPITTEDLKKIIYSFTKNQKFAVFKESFESVRKYYWLIGKILNKCDYLTNEEKMRCYKIVLNYYRLIRFKMLYSKNPTSLIQNLVYVTVKRYYRYKTRNRTERAKDFFEIKNKTFLNRPLKEIFKVIKANNLDNDIAEKIEV